jgi:spermidine/putrescine transport system ATP-binding protein/putrescine transport system ATP-binding protein
MSAALRLDAVSKRFGAVAAVEGASLDVAEGEFLALLGPSGSGKTTLLRMLAGFETPSAGRILLDGRDVTATPPERRPVNMMFQSYALFPHMSVRGNVAYGLEMERRPRAEIRARVDAILAVTRLDALADRRPDQLSGGQRQRVALARALVKRPRALLLDEPLSALDRNLRAAMQVELKRLQREVGVTTVMVTHDQEEALAMADRVAVLKDGRLRQVGAPEAVYERPADRFVAGFIGAMNFIPGRAAAGGVEAGGALIAAAHALAPGARAVAAVRPERLHLAPRPEATNRIEGVVEAIAYHGLDRLLHLRSPLAPEPVVARLTADEAERRPVAPGDRVSLGFAPADTRVFPDDPEAP